MKRRILILLIFIIIMLLFVFKVWMKPTPFLKGVESEKIHSIAVKDGGTGRNYSISDSEDIRMILRKIQSATFQKSGISLFHMGTLYTLSFYDLDEKKFEEFIVMDDHTFRKDPFFYSSTSEIPNLSQIIKKADPTIVKESKSLTMEDVIAFSKKEEIFWDDLWEFKPTRTTGSGLSIFIYDINERYYLVVGNSGPELLGKPVYIKLNKNLDGDGYIDNDPSVDILTEDVETFLE